MNAGISTSQVWVKEPTDASMCSGCESIIVSAKYVLSVEVKMMNKSEIIPSNTVLCESCYEARKLKDA
jgi:hypothetical protein